MNPDWEKKPLVHGAQPLLVMCVGRADVHDWIGNSYCDSEWRAPM